jgi:cation-transporting ATPase G
MFINLRQGRFGALDLTTVVFFHELAEILLILNTIRAARTRSLPGSTVAAVKPLPYIAPASVLRPHPSISTALLPSHRSAHRYR